MQKNTCNKECLMWAVFDGKCPNHYVNMFYPTDKLEEAYQVDDCAPIRTMLLMKELHSATIGTQKAFEEQRNEMEKSLMPIKDFVEIVKHLALNKKEQIEA
jgi:hypothetical protein